MERGNEAGLELGRLNRPLLPFMLFEMLAERGDMLEPLTERAEFMPPP